MCVCVCVCVRVSQKCKMSDRDKEFSDKFPLETLQKFGEKCDSRKQIRIGL